MKRFPIAFLLALVIACCPLAACSPATPTPQPSSTPVEAPTESAPADPIAAHLSKMSLEQKVAQLFIVRPESIAPNDGTITMMDDIVRSGLTTNTPGGICYFADNIETPDQTRKLLKETQEVAIDASSIPLIQSVDEEGGEVARVANNPAMNVPDVGTMGQIGAKGDPAKAYDAAVTISDYLKDLGFNTDFAPVADVADGVGNAIGQRAFDSSAETVAPMVVEQVRAFNEVSMLSSAKHFPGLGSVSGDSHQGSIETDRTLEEMDASELVPFRAAIEAGVPMIMVGHIACPAITGDDTPASLSHTIVTDVLRGHLGFDGLVITDSLEMGAVEGMAAKDQGVQAIKAGCDLVLLPQDYEAAYNGVLDAVKSGDITEEQIDEHLSRILRVKLAWMGDLPRWNS